MNVLAKLLSSRTRAEILRLLFGMSFSALHLRELERLSGLSTGSLRQEMSKLKELWLVSVRKDGNRTYYQANKLHALYPDIHKLVLKTVGLADVLRDALKDNSISCALVFGSVAKGEETAESDVDLLVLGKIGLRKLAGRLSGVSDILGREINPLVMTPDEFAKRIKAREHLVSGILDSPKLFIIGGEDELEAMGK
jgi:predicted nucleotidyltransferase